MYAYVCDYTCTVIQIDTVKEGASSGSSKTVTIGIEVSKVCQYLKPLIINTFYYLCWN